MPHASWSITINTFVTSLDDLHSTFLLTSQIRLTKTQSISSSRLFMLLIPHWTTAIVWYHRAFDQNEIFALDTRKLAMNYMFASGTQLFHSLKPHTPYEFHTFSIHQPFSHIKLHDPLFSHCIQFREMLQFEKLFCNGINP